MESDNEENYKELEDHGNYFKELKDKVSIINGYYPGVWEKITVIINILRMVTHNNVIYQT